MDTAGQVNRPAVGDSTAADGGIIDGQRATYSHCDCASVGDVGAVTET
jgi:hypothetical protein